MSQPYRMERIPAGLLSPFLGALPIVTEATRLAFRRGTRIVVRWAIEAVTALIAAVAVAGIAIGFASLGDGDDSFFELASQSMEAVAELFR